jgi:SAM-dependent methyltransferase
MFTDSDGRDFVFCTVCRTSAPALGPGPGGRPNAACVSCGSLERHRVMAVLLPHMMARSATDSIVLDIAPTNRLSQMLREHAGTAYASIDFDPIADGRTVNVQASVTMLPIRSSEVGFALCSHVLEHVPDDRAAVAEIKRTLTPDGVALIQVPRRLGVPTDEEPSASPEERQKRFGQADHVRYYGDDFEDRLEEAGLRVLTSSYSKILPWPLLRLMGASQDEELWIATTGADPHRFIDTQAATLALARSLMGSEETQRELEGALSEAALWRSRYEWLRNKPVVRLGSASKRLLKNGASIIWRPGNIRGIFAYLRWREASTKTFYCPACKSAIETFLPGPNGRPGARCPSCGSLERHRFLAVLIGALREELTRAQAILEIAPTPIVARILRADVPGRYVAMDIDPAADGRTVDIIGDLCEAPLATGSVDVAVCFHVFEHIPDDRRAMSELARLLSPRGFVFIQVPWNRGSPTDEDPHAIREERIRRFGQADHVRLYGSDLENRLLDSGLQVWRISVDAILPPDAAEMMRLRGHIWIASPSRTTFSGPSDAELEELIRFRLESLSARAWG